MTQKNKELLLRDLCCRLPHGVWIESKLKSCKFGAKSMLNAYDIYLIERGQYDFYKPYLFPLSNMSDEQYKEYCELEHSGDMEHLSIPLLDWCNRNHFDYRGLIPMGLALDATNLNIY